MASSRVEEPVTTHGKFSGVEGSQTTHPAYGQIRASRVSGASVLYGSDFVHRHTIEITIARSELTRGLSHDWHHACEDLISVSLSEAQWATFVSALNVGAGVPCTLEYVDGKHVPRLPAPVARTEQFTDEVKEKLAGSLSSLRSLSQEIEEMKLPVGKTKQIQHTIGRVLQELKSNLPFVAKSFDEHVERGVEAAKTEIHGYMTGVLTRAGLDSLAGPIETPPLIEDQR